MLFSVGGFSVPVFVLGYVLIYVISMKLHWLPVQGYRGPFQGLGPFFAHIALPTLTLSVIFIALIARMTRASAIEVLQEDYVRKIGRAHVCTPVTNAHLVCRLLLEKQNINLFIPLFNYIHY